MWLRGSKIPCPAFYFISGMLTGSLFFFFFLLGQIGKRHHGLGGEYRHHGDDGSGEEAGRDCVPGEDRDDGVSGLVVRWT